MFSISCRYKDAITPMSTNCMFIIIYSSTSIMICCMVTWLIISSVLFTLMMIVRGVDEHYRTTIAITLSPSSTGDPLLGPGFRRRLRNPHQWNLFSVRTQQDHQHRWKLSLCLHVSLLPRQSPCSGGGGSERNHVPAPRGLCCEDQRPRAGGGDGERRGQV